MRPPASLALALSMICQARRSAVPLASVTMPATAAHAGSPWWRGPCNRALLPARRPCGRDGSRREPLKDQLMAYAARYVFQAAYDAHRELTELFDFVAPTAIALWNLRWQVQGFLKEVPNATSNDLSNRFAFGSGMRGGEL